MRVKGVIFDWAGTVVDFGSRAPVAAFLDLFARHGVTASVELTRRFMGAHKRDHVRHMLQDDEIRTQWRQKNPQAPDLDALYAEFVPLQLEAILRTSQLIPGIVEMAAELRGMGIKIGGTTGYTRELMAPLEPEAARQGFAPDANVCADEVPQGRPAPWMALRAAQLMGTWPMSACVKVGDTVADIEEGRNGGMWTVAVTRTGNEIGMTEAEWSALSPTRQESLLEAARHKLLGAAAHYVIDSAADLGPVLEDISARLELGARP